MIKVKPSIQILILIIATFIVRIITFYFFGDLTLQNEWRVLVHNLSEKGTLGFYVINEESDINSKLAEENELVLPSVFMPPFYAFFIFIIKFLFSNIFNYVVLIIFFQIFLSTISIYIFYRIINLNESQKTAFYFALVLSIIPINIYSAIQISSISIQIFILIYYLYILKIFTISKEMKLINLIIFSFLSGFLILLRGEFILFFLLTIFYFFLFYTKKFKLFLISLIFTLLIISPYLIRNYYHFNVLTITKSFGYNLLKGNNPGFKVEGNATYVAKKYNLKSLNIEPNKNYEIKLDNFYKQKAIEYIKENPKNYLKNYFLKVISFILLDFNSSYKNYYNIFHIIPKIILSILSFIGGIIALKKKGYEQFLSIYFFSSIFFFSIFFILPRYSLILLPIQMLLSIIGAKYILRKFLN